MVYLRLPLNTSRANNIDLGIGSLAFFWNVSIQIKR